MSSSDTVCYSAVHRYVIAFYKTLLSCKIFSSVSLLINVFNLLTTSKLDRVLPISISDHVLVFTDVLW